MSAGSPGRPDVGAWAYRRPARAARVGAWRCHQELAASLGASRPWLSRAVAAVSVATGIVAASWSGITIRALAVVVGVGLGVGGALKLRSAFFGEGDECKNGERVELRLYPGVAHLVTGHEAAPAVLRWIAERFAGKPPPTTCT